MWVESLALINFHSYLKASTVLILLARYAGTEPATAPVIVANARQPANSQMLYNGAKKLQPRLIRSVFAAEVMMNPIPIPIRPATKPRRADSNKNISKISEFFAPIAFSIPISLYLSRTAVNMVLVVLTAATMTDMTAMNTMKPTIILSAPE